MDMMRKYEALMRIIAISFFGSLAMWIGFAYSNDHCQGDAMLSAIIVFSICSAICMVPISYLAYRDSKNTEDEFVRKMRDDGRSFFKAFAIIGALCMGASIAIDSIDGGIWMFELGLWVEAIDIWIKGYISMVGFWYAPRGHKGL